MVTGATTQDLPYARANVFDVAADIERYPEFLAWWISAHICSRIDRTLRVEQVLGYGPLRLPFTSTAIIERPTRIDVTSTQAPFRRYRLCMQFEAPSPQVCRLHVESIIELESALLQGLADRLVPRSLGGIVAAFAQRTGQLQAAMHAGGNA